LLVTENSLTMHRLVQTVVRAGLPPTEQQEWTRVAVRLVNAAFPSDSSEVATWPACALLLPHLLAAVDHAEALEIEAEATAELRINAGLYLWSRGQYQQALVLEEQALAARRRELGDNHLDTLKAMHDLGETRHDLGDLDGARELHEKA
jgi:tetratricopeptide (TPR) repeat protein